MGKKDHFVPVAYLHQFATDETKNKEERREWKIYRLAKQAYEPQEDSIISVAHSTYFERFANDEERTQHLKNDISKLEDSFFPVQAKLIDTQDLFQLSGKELAYLLYYVAFQHERTLAARNYYKKRVVHAIKTSERALGRADSAQTGNLTEEAVEKLEKLRSTILQIIELGSRAELENLCKSFNLSTDILNSNLLVARIVLRSIFLHHLKNLEKSANSGEMERELIDDWQRAIESRQAFGDFHLNLLLKRTSKLAVDLTQCVWTLWTNETSQPFWTSDNPAVSFLQPQDEELEPLKKGYLKSYSTLQGIVNPVSIKDKNGNFRDNFCLLFPLSPVLLLRIDRCDPSYNSEFSIRTDNGVMSEEEHIHSLNLYQWLQTSRNVYCSEQKFSAITRMRATIRVLLDEAESEFEELKGILDSSTSAL